MYVNSLHSKELFSHGPHTYTDDDMDENRKRGL